MSTRTTGRMAAVAVASAAGLALLAPAAAQAASFTDSHTAAAQAAPAAKIPAKLTVSGYKTYLKKHWKNGGRETFIAFSKLTPTQQKRFLRLLEDRSLYRDLQTRAKGSIGKPVHVSDPSSKKDVRFVTDVISRTAKDAAGTTTVRFSLSERIYNIPVTTKTLTVKFAAKDGKAKKTFVTPSVRNVNAAIDIKAGPARVSSKGAVTNAAVSWTAKPLVRAFGTKKVLKDQTVRTVIAQKTAAFTAQLANR